MFLVRGCISEGSGSKADLAVGSVIDVVETLQESHAVDKVQALTTRAPKICDNEVDALRVTTNRRVQLSQSISA